MRQEGRKKSLANDEHLLCFSLIPSYLSRPFLQSFIHHLSDLFLHIFLPYRPVHSFPTPYLPLPSPFLPFHSLHSCIITLPSPLTCAPAFLIHSLTPPSLITHLPPLLSSLRSCRCPQWPARPSFLISSLTSKHCKPHAKLRMLAKRKKLVHLISIHFMWRDMMCSIFNLSYASTCLCVLCVNLLAYSLYYGLFVHQFV